MHGNLEEVQFHGCRHKFHFGGDGECWSHWVMQLPMCIASRFGQGQVFLLQGMFPLLCGRPIIEALGIVIDFQNKQVRMNDGPYQSATIGLPVWEPDQPMDSGWHLREKRIP